MPAIARLLHLVRRIRRPRSADLPTLRAAMLAAIGDCDGASAQRLQRQIRASEHRRDLWLLRSDAYHLIALQHCQAIADERLRGLLHLFGGGSVAGETGRSV